MIHDITIDISVIRELSFITLKGHLCVGQNLGYSEGGSIFGVLQVTSTSQSVYYWA